MQTDYLQESKEQLLFLGKLVLIVFGATLYTLIVCRATEAKEAKKYEEWKLRYVSDFLAQRDAELAGMPVDPYDAQLDAEAQELAKVLYGVKDNAERDLRTMCWCVFNRVDSAEYPDSVPEVIAQPKQWMRYSPDNPVLEDLYEIARHELDAWHSGTTRPISAEYVYMTWTPTQIKLRNAWRDDSGADYWRYGG